MKKRKIALFIRGFHNGGIEKVFEMYYTHMDLASFEIHIITYLENDPNKKAFFEKLGCVVHEISPIKGSQISWKNIKEYKALFSKYKFNIVHNNMPEIVLPVIFGKIYKVPFVIMHSHSVYTKGLYGWKAVVYKRVFRTVAGMSNLLIGASTEALDSVFGKVKKPSIILPNAIEIDKFRFIERKRLDMRKQLGLRDEDIVLGHVGRFDGKLKNHDLILEIFEKLSNENDAFKLVLVGDGKYRKTCEKIVSDKEMKTKVIFTGISYAVQEYLMAMDIFLFPSKQEGLGIAAIEAQATGLPCLISNQVPRQVKVTEGVKFLSIEGNDAAYIWAEEIKEIVRNRCYINSEIYADQVKAAGYDIKDYANILRDIYLSGKGY